MKTEIIKTNPNEIRYVKSQKRGWVAINKNDRDWLYSVSEEVMYKRMIGEDSGNLL